MVCVRGQQQCSLLSMCRISGSLLGSEARLFYVALSQGGNNVMLPSCLPSCHWASSLDHLLALTGYRFEL